jgi:hypothetical protein
MHDVLEPAAAYAENGFSGIGTHRERLGAERAPLQGLKS